MRTRWLIFAVMWCSAFSQAIARGQKADLHPPIPIRIELAEPGFVTLVIEDADGNRVRNLVSETPMEKGANTIWWDALDDLGRDTEAAKHGVYHIPGKLVSAGTYRVRGLVRPAIGLTYQITPYNPGNPPWLSKDRSSSWLANHTPPSAILFVPQGAAPDRPEHPAPGGQILVGSFVSEGGSGLAWLNLEGKKLHGQEWVGGVWTGATQLCRDEGEHPIPGVYAYTGSAWRGDKYNGNRPELRLHMLNGQGKLKAPGDRRMGTGEDLPVLQPTYQLPASIGDPEHSNVPALGGLAASNGILVAAVTPSDQLVFIDVAAHKTLATASLEKPRGLAFDRQGRLLAVSGNRIVRLQPPHLDPSAPTTQQAQITAPQVVVSSGLDEPQQLALDKDGNLYVSDRGNNHQVKVFSPEGKPLRSIGTAGKPALGPYDPSHMHNPNGITIDGTGRLWVAETDFLPKRLSVWSLDGKLLNAFYGPAHYGGGGSLDPADKQRFFYADSGGGLELKLDWQTGAAVPTSVYLRPELDALRKWFGNDRTAAPETPLLAQGRTYLTDSYNTNPTGGIATASLWLLQNGVAMPVAVIGQANDLLSFNPKAKTLPGAPAPEDPAPLASRLPPGTNLSRDRILFLWSDRNDDGQVQLEEITCVKGDTLSVNFRSDLSAATGTGLLLKPARFTPGGAPIFDATSINTFASDTQRPVSSGGGQAIVASDGKFVLINAPKPFSPYGIGGGQNGKATWSYPSLWPGLHASHNAAMLEFPGELIGTTRLLGLPVTPKGSDLGEVLAINGNKGNVYLVTTDGLFVATLFRDSRTAAWAPSASAPGTHVEDQSLQEEDFFPTINQVADGSIYLSTVNCALVQVEGLEKAHRLPPQELSVSQQQIAAAQHFFLDQEAARQASQEASGPKELIVKLKETPPAVDGKLDDWSGAKFVPIDQRVTQIGDWGHRKIATEAALCISKGRLYLALRTDDPKLLENSGELLQNLFKTGGCIDLMLGADPAADPKREHPVAGDERLLVTRVKQKIVAVLYHQVSSGGKGQPAEFTSPIKTVKFASVSDVSNQIELAQADETDKSGKVIGVNYELSVPLETLGLHPTSGQSIRGDVGVLRGNGFQTLQRVYWSNKATGLVSDLPSEAELTPKLWGVLKFQ